MEILVTGANGFLGKSIVNELSKDNTLYSLSRTSRDYAVSLDIEIPRFTQKFDLVIHAAGKAHSIPKHSLDKKQFFDVNVTGTLNLLKGLEAVHVPQQFVFISSVSVYGKEIGTDIKEEHALEAQDPYGLSKLQAEEIIVKWCKDHDVVCSILRLPLLVGENPPGNLGAMLRMIEKGYYFNIGGGKAKKSMVLVDDVTSFISTVAAVGGIYNLTDGFHPSFKELSLSIIIRKKKIKPLNLPLFLVKIVGYVGDLLGDRFPIDSLKIRKITSDLTFDDSKARKSLGWKPQSVLEYIKNNNL